MAQILITHVPTGETFRISIKATAEEMDRFMQFVHNHYDPMRSNVQQFTYRSADWWNRFWDWLLPVTPLADRNDPGHDFN